MAVELNAPCESARILPFRRPHWNPNHPALQPPLKAPDDRLDYLLDHDAAAAICQVLAHARDFVPEPRMIDRALELMALASPAGRP